MEFNFAKWNLNFQLTFFLSALFPSPIFPNFLSFPFPPPLRQVLCSGTDHGIAVTPRYPEHVVHGSDAEGCAAFFIPVQEGKD
jgi:hypothetical protein